MRRVLAWLVGISATAMAMAMGCAPDISVEHPPERTRLSCPRPERLPFDLEADGFLHAEHTDLTGPVADVAADTLGNLGGVVSSTDEPLTVEPSARNVHYIGRKARYADDAAVAPTPIADELVSLWFFDPRADGWAWTGRVKTDEDGQYRFLDTVAEHPSTEPVYAMLDGDGSCAAHFDALYPRGMPVVVTEIDDVLARTDGPRRGAARAMRAWSEKGYPLIYLTSRPESARASTRVWLDVEDFPPGALVTGPPDSALKRIWLARMRDAFGWAFVAAYAASASDVSDYRAAGVGAARVFAIDTVLAADCVSLLDFDEHREDLIDIEPDAPKLSPN
ncbi:MAG: hypothetical protein U0414_02550 [Polyangiaceae bacterium]